MNSNENCYCVKEPQKLYRIGVFAQMNRVTIKALRYYDEIGLLHPEAVDEINGYRYYTSSQMPKLHKILALKEMGFSIQEIQQVIKGEPEENLLQRKKSELLRDMAELSKKIAGIESYLSKDYLKSDYHVIMKNLPEVIIASMRVNMESYEDLFQIMPEMGMLMEQAGCECVEPNYCFTIYHDGGYKEFDINAEICEAVTELKENTGNLKFTRLPQVETAACVLHKGAYNLFPQAYSAIIQYIEEIGYEIVGPPRESYIDGIWNKDRVEDWLTEIQFPIKKSQSSI